VTSGALRAKEMGNAAFSAGHHSTAIKHFTLAIRLDKNNHLLYSNRSACHASLRDASRALEDASACLRIAPTWVKGYSRRGAALVLRGDYKEALRAFRQGLEIEPGNPGLQKGYDDLRLSLREGQLPSASLADDPPPAPTTTSSSTTTTPPSTSTSTSSSATSTSTATAATAAAASEHTPPTPRTSDGPTAAAPHSHAHPTKPAGGGGVHVRTVGSGVHGGGGGGSGSSRSSSNGVPLSLPQRWLDAAKRSDRSEMQAVLSLSDAQLLVHHKGRGIGHTAMHWAAVQGDCCSLQGEGGSVMAWLLSLGAEVDARNHSEATPLHAAASNGQAMSVSFLLRHGADASLTNEDGQNPAQLAAKQKRADIEQEILAHLEKQREKAP